MILVDSAVWIDLLCNRSSVPVARLRKLLELGEAAAVPVIVQEILRCAVSPVAFEKLQELGPKLKLMPRN